MGRAQFEDFYTLELGKETGEHDFFEGFTSMEQCQSSIPICGVTVSCSAFRGSVCPSAGGGGGQSDSFLVRGPSGTQAGLCHQLHHLCGKLREKRRRKLRYGEELSNTKCIVCVCVCTVFMTCGFVLVRSASERSFTIRGLPPDYYQLWMTASTASGQGPRAGLSFFIKPQSECNERKSENNLFLRIIYLKHSQYYHYSYVKCYNKYRMLMFILYNVYTVCLLCTTVGLLPDSWLYTMILVGITSFSMFFVLLCLYQVSSLRRR